MAINKAMRMALKALSYDGVKEIYKLQRTAGEIKAPHVLKPVYEQWDRSVICDEHEIPVRVYPPPRNYDGKRVILFFHGGGWVTENVNTYNSVCKTMAQRLCARVVSVDYRLAPENRFPDGLKDCYAVAKEIFTFPELFNTKTEDIILVGDSAGGNLAAVVSMIARDSGDFKVPRQVLLYPATYNDHTENSPFRSVIENGRDYLLTAGAVQDYMDLYKSKDDDIMNPYFAPLLAENFSGLPETLIITAEFDPLRDEGEEFGLRIRKAGGVCRIYRMKDALHGFFSMNYRFAHVKRAYELINEFLNGEELR